VDELYRVRYRENKAPGRRCERGLQGSPLVRAVVLIAGSFIPPMLCQRLTDLRRLADRGYVAEPKLDG
jgi:hypothetical protein